MQSVGALEQCSHGGDRQKKIQKMQSALCVQLLASAQAQQSNLETSQDSSNAGAALVTCLCWDMPVVGLTQRGPRDATASHIHTNSVRMGVRYAVLQA